MNAIETGEFYAVTSEMTLAELLPKLIVDGESALTSLYQHLFSGDGLFEAAPISREVLIQAAQIRAARMSIKLPDAIHLATAATTGCAAILSNDQRLATPGRLPLVAICTSTLDVLRSMSP